MKNLVESIKKLNPDLKTAEIEGLLFLLKEHPILDSLEFIRLTGLPRETLKTFKHSIGSLLYENKESVSLNEEGRKSVADLTLKPYEWSLLSYSNEILEKKLDEIKKKYWIEPKREYDQFFATTNTSISKAILLNERGMVDNKKIALLGDDDLVSIALSLLNPHFTSITVFDVDPDLLKKIESIAVELGIQHKIKTVLYDARKELPRNQGLSFDVVMTDPPYTSSGISLFLYRSILMLGNQLNHDKGIVLFYGNSFKSPEKTLKVQDIINRYGLVVEEKIDKFCRYYGADSIGSASSAYILGVSTNTNTQSHPLNTEIYTYEKNKEEKFPYVDHFTIKATGVSDSILKSKKQLGDVIAVFCSTHRLNIVDTKVTQFKKFGYSFTFILSTSNLLMHTWPEYNAIHIDLITCAPIYSRESLGKTLSELFKTKNIEVRRIE